MKLVTLFKILFISIVFINKPAQATLIINDISRLNPTVISKIIHVKNTDDIKKSLNYAKKHYQVISISGALHSQGGQNMYPNSIHLDMVKYNKIVDIDAKHKTITIQSGATWEIIQNKINPYNLSVKVMQSSNIFTVGGSISANIHGRDPNYGPLIVTIKSFHLLTSNNEIIEVSPSSHPELFNLVVGGYGLFGVILDATFSLTTNNLLKYKANILDYKEFNQFFNNHIKNKPNISIFFGRLSIAPHYGFLKQMYITRYISTNHVAEKPQNLIDQDKKHGYFFELLFNFSRKFSIGKDLLWFLEKIFYVYLPDNNLISRNNAMRPAIKFLTNYKNPENTDILQEYFIPVGHFKSFTDKLRHIVKQYKINLLNVTIRYEPANHMSIMSYSKQDNFAFVIYINVPISKSGIMKAKKWTRKLIAFAEKENGSYYLPYELWATKKELIQSYPNLNQFCQLKRKYDPTLIFMNQFYYSYCLNTST